MFSILIKLWRERRRSPDGQFKKDWLFVRTRQAMEIKAVTNPLLMSPVNTMHEPTLTKCFILDLPAASQTEGMWLAFHVTGDAYA